MGNYDRKNFAGWYLLSANILLLNKIPIRKILGKCSDIANQLFRI